MARLLVPFRRQSLSLALSRRAYLAVPVGPSDRRRRRRDAVHRPYARSRARRLGDRGSYVRSLPRGRSRSAVRQSQERHRSLRHLRSRGRCSRRMCQGRTIVVLREVCIRQEALEECCAIYALPSSQ